MWSTLHQGCQLTKPVKVPGQLHLAGLAPAVSCTHFGEARTLVYEVTSSVADGDSCDHRISGTSRKRCTGKLETGLPCAHHHEVCHVQW